MYAESRIQGSLYSIDAARLAIITERALAKQEEAIARAKTEYGVDYVGERITPSTILHSLLNKKTAESYWLEKKGSGQQEWLDTASIDDITDWLVY